MTTIAIMQPYFMPYLGYFRLLALADIFVIYDCVQFPRRGWVHRNKLNDSNGVLQWLTLPLARAAQTTPIQALKFRPNAGETFATECRRFPALQNSLALHESLFAMLCDFSAPVVDYLERNLKYVCNCLELHPKILRSSSLALNQELTGQARIVAICQALDASAYLNASGGRTLYDGETFAKAAVTLQFLSEFQGRHNSILERLLSEPHAQLRQELQDNLQISECL